MKELKQQDRPPGGRNRMRNIWMGIAGLVAVIYLLNPDAGLLELIPDNIPLIGNLDEVAATLLLLRVLAYFGWRPFSRRSRRDRRPGE